MEELWHDEFASVVDLLVTVLIPALFGLVLIGIGIRLGIKYLRAGAAASGGDPGGSLGGGFYGGEWYDSSDDIEGD